MSSVDVCKGPRVLPSHLVFILPTKNPNQQNTGNGETSKKEASRLCHQERLFFVLGVRNLRTLAALRRRLGCEFLLWMSSGLRRLFLIDLFLRGSLSVPPYGLRSRQPLLMPFLFDSSWPFRRPSVAPALTP